MVVMTCWFHIVGQCFWASGSLVSSEAEIMAAVERGMCLCCAVAPPFYTFYLLQACAAVVPIVPSIR